MADVPTLVAGIVASLASGGGGAFATWMALRRDELKEAKAAREDAKQAKAASASATSAMRTRLDTVESELKDLRRKYEEGFAAASSKLASEADKLREQVAALEDRATELESGLTHRAEEARRKNALVDRLAANVSTMNESLANLKDAIARVDRAHSDEVKNGQTQWQALMRTVGNIEGILSVLQRRQSGGFPSPTIPK